MSKLFNEENVTINAQVALKGTLAIPEGNEGKYPAVLLVAGSGPIDRNGDVLKKKMNLNLYRELAEFITSLGFITLRYDKRGVGESEGDYLKTGMWDLVADIQSNIEFLKRHPKVDSEKIILLGHSEGSILITAANAQNPVSGLILLSGAAERLEDAVQRQRNIIFAELKNAKGLKGMLMRLLKVDKKGEAQAQKLLKKVRESKTDTMRQNFVKMNAKWFREHLAYDVIGDLKKAECPVLAVTGSKDFQANPERIKDVPVLVKGEADCHVVENMDHGLKEDYEPISALNFKKHYKSSIGKPLHPEFQKILSGWLIEHYQKSSPEVSSF